MSHPVIRHCTGAGAYMCPPISRLCRNILDYKFKFCDSVFTCLALSQTFDSAYIWSKKLKSWIYVLIFFLQNPCRREQDNPQFWWRKWIRSIYLLASALRNSMLCKEDENCIHIDSELWDKKKKSKLYSVLQTIGINFTVSKTNIS